MNSFRAILLLFLAVGAQSCSAQAEQLALTEDQIIEKYATNGAQKHGLYSAEWQEELDKGLALDSTIAYLWQQKGMPLYKQRKYEVGLPFIDKAVQYNPQEYQPYRAFLKCIFAKTYKDAAEDFEDCIHKFGNHIVMDHSYRFYQALSLLQLNQYAEAERLLSEDIHRLFNEKGEDWVHHLDLFYLGIAKYEQKKYLEAIETFDRALLKYPEFSDVQYYKALSLASIDKREEAQLLIQLAKKNGDAGFTINEDNVIYELYPYQMRW